MAQVSDPSSGPGQVSDPSDACEAFQGVCWVRILPEGADGLMRRVVTSRRIVAIDAPVDGLIGLV